MDAAWTPTPAERARSALAATDSLRLQAGPSSLLLDGGHGVLRDETVVLVEPAPRPLRSAGAAGVSQEQADHELDIRLVDYRSAVPDPLAPHERRHVVRLADRHPDAVDRLTALLDPADVVRSSRVVPVGLDSGGVTLRAEASDGWVDVRLPFPRRACCPGAAWQLLASLVEHGVVAGAPAACEPAR